MPQTLEPVNLAENPSAWLDRVFHNTYTYHGQRRSVRGWSVKIQFQGRRRTFSLLARTREEAAAEARQIFETLRLEGWDVVSQLAGHHGTAFSKTDVRYWKGRLTFRKYGSTAEPSYSARIDHEGSGLYFPLGRSDPDAAAAQALRIYTAVQKDGWKTVRSTHAYEITIAFHWSADPLLWSYTTLHAFPQLSRGRQTDNARSSSRVFLVEPNPELRNTLTACIQSETGVECVGYATLAQWKGNGPLGERPLPETGNAGSHGTKLIAERSARATQGVPAFGLVNIDALDSSLATGPAQLCGIVDGACVVPYSTHADSDDLFLSAPGGLSAYCFKRLLPKDVLRPILGVLGQTTSVPVLMGAVQSFFQSITQVPSTTARSLPRQVSFTSRENEVLALLSKGYVDKEIARALGISTWTVHEHVKRVFEKLGVHSRIEAALAYLQK